MQSESNPDQKVFERTGRRTRTSMPAFFLIGENFEMADSTPLSIVLYDFHLGIDEHIHRLFGFA
jgi:hypothetical protein